MPPPLFLAPKLVVVVICVLLEKGILVDGFYCIGCVSILLLEVVDEAVIFSFDVEVAASCSLAFPLSRYALMVEMALST